MCIVVVVSLFTSAAAVELPHVVAAWRLGWLVTLFATEVVASQYRVSRYAMK